MKKVISILLVVLVAFSAMSMIAGAEVISPEPKCTCANHKSTPANSCHCCVLCPNIEKSYLTACATNDNKDGSGTYDGSLCCSNCTGIFPCNCGCSCCKDNDSDKNDKPILGNGGELWNSDAQEEFVNGFQAILKRVSDVFDKIFNAIFEFLKIDGILGKK